MRSIVCDTGPLNYLIQIECIDVVGIRFKPVLLPDSCHRELFDMMAPEPVRQWASELPEWVNIRCCERSSGGPYRGLSLADSDVLAIAAETNSVLLYLYASTFRISSDTAMGGLNVAWASCPCPSAGRLRRNGGNPDLLIEASRKSGMVFPETPASN